MQQSDKSDRLDGPYTLTSPRSPDAKSALPQPQSSISSTSSSRLLKSIKLIIRSRQQSSQHRLTFPIIPHTSLPHLLQRRQPKKGALKPSKVYEHLYLQIQKKCSGIYKLSIALSIEE